MIINLTNEIFIEKIFDYKSEKEWKYKGGLPAIIDFWAPWCGPCKMIGPILEDLDKEYDNKIQIFKINTDEEQELAESFGIQSIPTLLFISKVEKPQMAMGALSKQSFKKVIEEVLKVS